MGAQVPYWVTDRGRWTGFLVYLGMALVVIGLGGLRRTPGGKETIYE